MTDPTPISASPGNPPARVLLVISDLGYGGAEAQVVALANGLGAFGLDVHVATLSTHIPLAERLDVRARLHPLTGRSPLALARLVRQLRPALLHGFLLDGEIAAALASLAVRGTVVLGSERSTHHDYRAWQRLLYRCVRGRFAGWVANSDAGARWHATAFRNDPARYHVVRNGVDTQRFSPGSGANVRVELGLDAHTPVIGMFASWKPAKNHAVLLHAVAALKRRGVRLRVLLVGAPVARAARGSIDPVSGVIATLGLGEDVCVLPPRADVERLYRVCTLTVLPSAWEGTPNVVLESLACGVPVLGSDVPGNRELLASGEGGELFDAGDAPQLANRIEALLGDPSRLAALRIAARQNAETHHALPRMLAAMATVYQATLHAT
ncbi:MAG: glycosyltransferase [Pseudomonadales bacterium]|nr:glycosyltransferase [Pseudomonadales bacterium]MCP5184796.1 glycosyltransferase [Pseudomonadales bacterium]